jgi:hypothetical protein
MTSIMLAVVSLPVAIGAFVLVGLLHYIINRIAGRRDP